MLQCKDNPRKKKKKRTGDMKRNYNTEEIKYTEIKNTEYRKNARKIQKTYTKIHKKGNTVEVLT